MTRDVIMRKRNIPRVRNAAEEDGGGRVGTRVQFKSGRQTRRRRFRFDLPREHSRSICTFIAEPANLIDLTSVFVFLEQHSLLTTQLQSLSLQGRLEFQGITPKVLTSSWLHVRDIFQFSCANVSDLDRL